MLIVWLAARAAVLNACSTTESDRTGGELCVVWVSENLVCGCLSRMRHPNCQRTVWAASLLPVQLPLSQSQGLPVAHLLARSDTCDGAAQPPGMTGCKQCADDGQLYNVISYCVNGAQYKRCSQLFPRSGTACASVIGWDFGATCDFVAA